MAAVYVLLTLPIILGVAVLSIDMSWLYARQAVAQKAADAAALAGALQFAQGKPQEAAYAAQKYAEFATNGGYVNGDNPDTALVERKEFAADNEVWVRTYQWPAVARPNWYKVTVSRPEPLFFARIWGWKRSRVTASATALYETNAELDINGSGEYGVAPGPVNLSLFGPDGFYNNGDKYSTRLLADRSSPNPDYNGLGAPNLAEAAMGYSFSLNMNNTFRSKTNIAYVQLFDPDCFNKNNEINANGSSTVDELRNAAGGNGNSSNATVTRYKLWYDPDGPGPMLDAPVPGAETSYGGISNRDIGADMKWNDAFAVDLNLYGRPENKLRLQVITTDGESENGFDLRISTGPLSNTAFNKNNGSGITAQGHLPINFNQGGSTALTLGKIPAEAAGGKMQISKFDTDVTNGSAANTVYYKCDPPTSKQPANGYVGKLSGQGQTVVDEIDLPSDYQGGTWTAYYSAGAQDTSVWDMSYSNSGPGRPGRVRLVE